jgi:hypothetical protein
MTTPEPFRRDECSSCHAPIIWAQLQSSRPIQIDFEPHAQGNVALSRRPWGVLAAPVKAMLAFGRTDLRRAHFASCPNADAHRKRPARAARYR